MPKATILNPTESAAQKGVEDAFQPRNGQCLIKFRPITQSVILPTSQGKQGQTPDTVDWKMDVISAAPDYWSATAGKHLKNPIKAGDVVTIQPGSAHTIQGYAGWKGYAIVYWEHILGLVDEGKLEGKTPAKKGPKSTKTVVAEDAQAVIES